MKRLLLCTVAAFGLFSGSANAEDLKFYTFDFKPFASADASGPFKDIISEACTRLNHACTFEALPWARAQAIAQNEGGITGLFVMGKNAEREEWMNFSIPLVTTEYGYFVPENNTATFTDSNSLTGYNVATFGPSNTSTQLEKIATESGFTPVVEKSMDIAMKKVAGGRFQGNSAVFGNTDVMKDLIKSENITGLKYFGQQKPVTYYIGFPKNTHDKAFVDAFNTTLSAMKSEGKIRSILTSYDMKEAE